MPVEVDVLAGGGGGGGGGAVTAANGAYVDGSIVTIGTEADTAYVSGNGTVIALLKGLFAKLADTLTISGSVTTSGTVTEANSTSINTHVGDIDTATGTQADAAWTSGNGSVIALLKNIASKLAAGIAVTGSFYQATQPVSQSVATALTPYASNPTATTANTDTTYKFGASGTTQANHVSIQNNTGANLYYAFDASTSTSTDSVYSLATGNTVWWDRAVTTLHFQTAASQNFNGLSGITVEGFA